MPCDTDCTELLMVGLRQTNDILIQGGPPAEPPALLEAVAPEPEGPAEPVEDQSSLEVLCAMGFSAAASAAATTSISSSVARVRVGGGALRGRFGGVHS